jgi:hypothetical protein
VIDWLVRSVAVLCSEVRALLVGCCRQPYHSRGSDLAVGLKEYKEFLKANVGKANVMVFEGSHVDGLDAGVEQGSLESLVNVVVFLPFAQALSVHTDGVCNLCCGWCTCRKNGLRPWIWWYREWRGTDSGVYGGRRGDIEVAVLASTVIRRNGDGVGLGEVPKVRETLKVWRSFNLGNCVGKTVNE